MSDGFRVGVFGDLGIFRAVGDVWAKAAVEDFDAVAKVSDVFLGFDLEFWRRRVRGLSPE